MRGIFGSSVLSDKKDWSCFDDLLAGVDRGRMGHIVENLGAQIFGRKKVENERGEDFFPSVSTCPHPNPFEYKLLGLREFVKHIFCW